MPFVDVQSEAQYQKLLQVLERIDECTRLGRAQRVVWLDLHEPRSEAATIGRPETIQILQEVREVFINGYFVATLLLAMSFIEHVIIEYCQLKGYIKSKESPAFGKILQIAEKNKAFPSDWLKRAKILSVRRNSFAHLKESTDANTLGGQISFQKQHPQLILENDAKNAIDLTYSFYVITTYNMNPKDFIIE